MAKEWYRKETWSTADELDFFAHLKRARSNYNKAQYLRIQACHLQSTTDEALARAAIQLAEKCVTDYPEEGSEIALCYLFMAESYSTLNEVKSATDAYLKCFDAQRRFPRHGTNAANSFAMFVIERDLTNLFEHAASALVEFNTHLRMPFEIYEHYGSLAIFAATEGLLNVSVRSFTW